MGHDLKIFTGNANRPLADEICSYLERKLGRARVETFPGGETRVQIEENIRGKDVFIVQPVCANSEAGLSPNDALMELLVLIDAARRASASRITAVLPYYGYARQDRKDRPRVPITAKLVANMIHTAGAGRVLSLDLHSNQIQGFFDIPFDHLYSINIFADYLLRKDPRPTVVVSPDVGNLRMARAYAELLGASLAVIDKRRVSGRKTVAMNLIGSVKDRNAVIIDDLISTGGSVEEAAATLDRRGALEISACIVHPILSEGAAERIEKSRLSELVVANSVPVPESSRYAKIKILSVAPLLAEAMRRINRDESVSTLFADIDVEG